MGSVCPSVGRHNEMGSFWTPFLLQFLTDRFEILQVFLLWSEDVYLILGLPSYYFFTNFFHFFDFRKFFSGEITIRIDISWAQLLLEISTDHLKLCILVLHGL